MNKGDTLLMLCIVAKDQRERAKGKHPWILTVKSTRTGAVQVLVEREYYLNDEDAQADIPRLNGFFKGMVCGDFDVVSLVEEK